MIVLDRNDTVVVPSEGPVTIVGASPMSVVVTEVEIGVSVVVPEQNFSVITLPVSPVVIPVQESITVVTAGEKQGPKIFFGSTPPVGADLNDIWIVTN